MRFIVTLLTDFGTVDGFVGAMKGVILARAPRAMLVDITHDIPPQDVAAGAWALGEAAPLFPPATIHLAVVDPGVGTERRPLLLRGPQGQLFLGPDNGLLSLAARGEGVEAWVLDREELFRPEPSRTFHGRDLFAPVAGHLAAGALPEECGSPVSSWTRLEEPTPVVSEGGIAGRVVHVDRFGNLITNIPAALLGERGPRGEPAPRWTVHLMGESIGPVRVTYADVERGTLVAYVGSNGTIEIAVREGRADRRAGAGRAEVTLCRA